MLTLIHIDKRKRIPIHQQVAFQIQELILTSRIANKSILPTYAEFNSAFQINEQEMALIVEYLSSQKLLLKANQQYFINTPIVSTKVVGRFKGIYPVIEAIGLTPSIKDIRISLVENILFPYDDRIYTLEKAWKIERLYLGSGRPLIYYEGYIPYDLFHDIKTTNYVDNRLYDIFENDYGYKITQSLRMVYGKSLNQTEARILNYPVGSSAMVIHLLNYNQNNDLIESSKLIAISDYLHIDQAVD